MLLTNQDIVGSLLPDVYLSRIILESKDDNLITNIQFTLNENFGKDDTSLWLQDSQLLKYLKIFVIESADKNLSDALEAFLNISSNDRSVLTSEQKLTTLFEDFFDLNQPIFEYKQINLFDYFGQTISQIQSRLQQNQINQQDLNNLDLEDLGITKINNSDGTITYNLFMDIKFRDKTEKNLQDLTYFFGSMFDLTSLLRDENLSENGDFTSIGVGNVFIEKVISGYELQSKTYIYQDKFGNIWKGPVHLLATTGEQIVGYRSGYIETADSIDLDRIEIPNYKVQDFRTLQTIKQIQNFQTLPGDNQQIIDLFQNIQVEEQFLTEKDNSSISEAYFSIDSDQNVALTFFIDFKKMFMKDSPYGQALTRYDSDTAKKFIDFLFLTSKIVGIKLKKRKIDLNNLKDKNIQTDVYYWDEETVSLTERPIDFTDLDESQILQLRCFTLTDKSNKEAGTYGYNVEIEYIDGVAEAINSAIDSLKQEQLKFFQYYEISLGSNVYNPITKRFNPGASNFFIGLEELFDFSISGQKYLNIMSGLYGLSDLQITTNQFNQEQSQTAITINNNTTTIQPIIDLFSSLLDPVSATPDTIYSVIKAYSDLITNLSTLISSVPFINNSNNEKNEGNATEESVKSVSKIININKQFTQTVNIGSSYTFEYLNHLRSDNTGINNTTSALYETLKSDLIAKKNDASKTMTIGNTLQHFNDSIYNNVSNIMSKFANLEIMSERFKDTNVAISRTNIKPKLLTTYKPIKPNFFENIKNIKINTVTSEEDRNVLNTTLLTMLNPTINNSLFDLNISLNDLDADNIFWKIQPEKATADYSVQYNQIVTKNLFKNTSITNQQANLIPNQLKSLIKSKITSPETIIGDAEIRFKYELLKQINVLNGFEYDQINRYFKMNAPKWDILKNNDFRNTLRFKFCKITDYINNSIRYKFNLALKEQCLNECFFINNGLYHDNYKIINGATMISKNRFEERVEREKKNYFKDQEEPNVKISINNITINTADSYSKMKYCIVSPIGIYFDNYYRLIVPSDVLNITNIGGNITYTLPNYSYIFPKLSSLLQTQTRTTKSKSQIYNKYEGHIYSRNRRIN